MNPGTFRKRRDKGDKATLLIASAVAGVRRKWAQALKDFFAILEVSAIFQKLQIPDRLRLGLFVAGRNHEVNH